MIKFKDFILEEKPNAKPKAKGEADFVAQHDVEVTDKEDQAENSLIQLAENMHRMDLNPVELSEAVVHVTFNAFLKPDSNAPPLVSVSCSTFEVYAELFCI